MGRETENQNITMKTGVVDVGGGLRGIYAAGVLDYSSLRDNPMEFYIVAADALRLV